MCTIGTVFDGNSIHTFKQCDLIPDTDFNLPLRRKGTNGVDHYFAMTRGKNEGHFWAGVNSCGVAFVAADAYTEIDYYDKITDAQTTNLFNAYEDCVRSCTTATAAAAKLSKFYCDMDGAHTPFPAPDISLFSGWEDPEQSKPVSILLEYTPYPYSHSPVREVVRHDSFFAQTNHFRIQPNAVHYPANHSTYLRLQRAEMILQQTPDKEGVETLLKDQYYGPCDLSICRETDYPGIEYRTQATALFTTSPQGSPEVLYQVNGNPRTNPLRPFEGTAQ